MIGRFFQRIARAIASWRIGRVSVVTIAGGDSVVVLTSDRLLSPAQQDNINEVVGHVFGCRVAVLDGGLSLAAIVNHGSEFVARVAERPRESASETSREAKRIADLIEHYEGCLDYSRDRAATSVGVTRAHWLNRADCYEMFLIRLRGMDATPSRVPTGPARRPEYR